MKENMKNSRVVMKLLPIAQRDVLLLGEYCEQQGIHISTAKRLKQPIEGDWCEVIVRHPNGQERKLGEGEFFLVDK